MSLPGLLEHGIRAVLQDGASERELGELVASQHLPAEAADHIRETLVAMPGLLVAIERSLSKGRAEARELFSLAISYLLQEEDLIPTHRGRPTLGLLDDVYLLHCVAYHLRDDLRAVDQRSIAGGQKLLADLLPREIVRELDAKVAEIVSAVRAAERPG